jgi:hypothetical protein
MATKKSSTAPMVEAIDHRHEAMGNGYELWALLRGAAAALAEDEKHDQSEGIQVAEALLDRAMAELEVLRNNVERISPARRLD